MMHWEQLSASVWRFADSCQVYALAAPEGMVLINAGTGAWLDCLHQLPAPARALACTHFFRDHSAGAADAARQGIAVYAPYWEQEQFMDAPGLFQRRETYIIYDNTWDLFAPIEAIPVTGLLRDGDTVMLAGLPCHIVPTPGVTCGAISISCHLDGTHYLFCGEAIHSPGKVARVAPLQYNYNDLSGALNVIYSTRQLRRLQPDVLAPSLGELISEDTDGALAALDTNMRRLLAPRPEYQQILAGLDDDPLLQVSEHVYQSTFGNASSWFIISESGKALAIDYGYNRQIAFSGYPYPRNRRALLHGIDALKTRWGIEGIDLVLVTHFHDDHVNGIPTLQRLYGTRCWAGENFAHLSADPMSYNFPCTWPEPITVEPQPLCTPLHWEEYTFTLEPMSGHTRWSTLISFRADDATFMASGDQYFFTDWGVNDFTRTSAMHNHVYRNGALSESFHASNAVLRRVKPDIILPGHNSAYRTNADFYRLLDVYADDYRTLHADIMPLGAADAHFDVDSRMAWLIPYRVCLDTANTLKYQAVVRNPLPTEATVTARLSAPAGWEGETITLSAPARAEVTMTFTITPPPGTRCRRQPIALELQVNGRPYGQVTEALVTIGHPMF